MSHPQLSFAVTGGRQDESAPFLLGSECGQEHLGGEQGGRVCHLLAGVLHQGVGRQAAITEENIYDDTK